MARRPRDSVTPLRQSSPGWMPARIGRLSTGVGRRYPVTIRNSSLHDGGVNKAGMSTAAPNKSAVLCNRMDQV